MRGIVSKNKDQVMRRMLRVAAEIATGSDVQRHRFGTVLVANKTIISSGHNSQKTHPGQSRWNQLREAGKKNRSWVHAEVSCLSKIRWVPSGSVLFVARISPDTGEWMMARPCEACLERISQVKVYEVVYTTGPNTYALETLAA